MNKTQSYIIAGMTILIVVLCWFLYSANSSIDVYRQEIELSRLNEAKSMTQDNVNSELNDLSKQSTESVKKAKLIIKKITYETPKISDTTGVYMLEYVRNFRPE